MTVPSGTLQTEFERVHGTEHEFVECDHDEQFGSVTEIAVEQTACYGFCSAYTMTLHPDGTVTYAGAANVERIGSRHGRVPLGRFRYLATLAEEIGYFELLDDYSCPVTDNPTVFTSVRRGQEIKIIRHYAPSLTGPARLRAFEDAVAHTYEWIEWDN
jgi:hypothetical protein